MEKLITTEGGTITVDPRVQDAVDRGTRTMTEKTGTTDGDVMGKMCTSGSICHSMVTVVSTHCDMQNGRGLMI